MGIEPTTRFGRVSDFEDQGSHQTPVASMDVTLASGHGANKARDGQGIDEVDAPDGICVPKWRC